MSGIEIKELDKAQAARLGRAAASTIEQLELAVRLLQESDLAATEENVLAVAHLLALNLNTEVLRTKA